MDDPLTNPSIDLKGRRILAVDDDRINLRIIGGILRNEGYELAEAASGEQALEVYKTFQPNLVLLDVMMPGIDGFATCRTLKKTYGDKCAPVIFVTAKSEADHRHKKQSGGRGQFGEVHLRVYPLPRDIDSKEKFFTDFANKSKFEKLREVQMRVGALPVYPTNALKYNLTWSTDGLINEYCNPCESIRDGARGEVPALEELEAFSLDGITYEAFNTSGGLGTLCDTLEGKVENLNYKTVRYPGHRDIVKMLVRDLRLGLRRDIMKDVLETAIPITYQDVVLIFVTVSGWMEGRLTQESYAKKIYAQTIGTRLMSAIQITTAAGICAMCDLLVDSKLPQKGFVRQEEANLADFLSNRFGRHYA